MTVPRRLLDASWTTPFRTLHTEVHEEFSMAGRFVLAILLVHLRCIASTFAGAGGGGTGLDFI